MCPWSYDGHRHREATMVLPASGGSGLGLSGTVSTSKRLSKRRKWKQAQDAEWLEPNWHCGGFWVSHIPRRGQPTPPAERANLPRSVTHAKPGKPDVLPQ